MISYRLFFLKPIKYLLTLKLLVEEKIAFLCVYEVNESKAPFTLPI